MRNKKGFTLIELMICISIVVLLCAIAIPNIIGQDKNKLRKASKKVESITKCERGYMFYKSKLQGEWNQVLGEDGAGATCRDSF